MKSTAAITAIVSSVTAAVILTLGAVSCEKYVLPEMHFTPDTLRVNCEGGDFPVRIDVNVKWKATAADGTRVTVIPDSGDGAADLQINVAPNQASEPFSTDVTFESETLRKRLVIIQDGARD